MVNVGDAVTYPTESEDWTRIMLIGGVLSLFSFLIIPGILVYGYIIQVIRARFDESSELPEFDDWGDLFIDGAKVWVIGIIYLLIPLIVGAVTVGGSLLAIATGTRGGVAAGVGGLIVGFVLTAVLGLIFSYFAVAAMLNFAHEEEFSAGFEFGTIKTLVLSGDYAVAWVAALVVFLIASFISGVLNIIPFLGAVIGAFIFFYAQLVAAYLWADGFTEAIGSVSHAESTSRTDASRY